jgi:hypothetical protein
MVKSMLKPFIIFRIVIYYHAPQPMSMADHSINTDPIIVLFVLMSLLTYKYSMA